jgi:hypothetical protein
MQRRSTENVPVAATWHASYEANFNVQGSESVEHTGLENTTQNATIVTTSLISKHKQKYWKKTEAHLDNVAELILAGKKLPQRLAAAVACGSCVD